MTIFVLLQTDMMEIGIDSFAAMFSGDSNKAINDADALAQLLEK